MSCFGRVIGVIIILVAIGFIVMYSGAINIGATEPHSPIAQYVLSTTMENSVRYHAKDIQVPPLDNPAMIMEGFRHYREMCVMCHLAPGVKATEIHKGLRPEPPELYEGLDEWKPNQLFWIVKHGIKMTGMPAWGPTHSDDKIWAIVAFLEKLPKMNAAQFREMDRKAGPAGEDEDEHALDHGKVLGRENHAKDPPGGGIHQT